MNLSGDVRTSFAFVCTLPKRFVPPSNRNDIALKLKQPKNVPYMKCQRKYL